MLEREANLRSCRGAGLNSLRGRRGGRRGCLGEGDSESDGGEHHLEVGRLKRECLRVMDVADGDSESVGGIGWFGHRGEVEQASDHELHLLLLRKAVASYGGFDLEGSILGSGQMGSGGGEQRDSTDLAQL